ncbi:Self-incompatibility protein [Trema orientale]|uniref:Self-incompatibility protein n=1 Tax=Trema orientale TaxID=63057 RepID=A0A2P5D5X6_TREOI|nr:Self-incompatibility protein [Trema orientale]
MCEAVSLIRMGNLIGKGIKLRVQCKTSKDDGDRDTGSRDLPYLATCQFKPIAGNKVYKCMAEWSNKYRYSFDINTPKRAKYDKNCWAFKSSGPCLCDCKNAACTYNDDCYHWDYRW